MVTTDFLKFTLQLLIAGALIRGVTMKIVDKDPNNPLGKALSYIY